MYFNVPDILIATSDNLIAWTPLEDMNGTLLKVLSPRPGHFDSWLVEAGPPALITEHGILVLYNAGNSDRDGVPDLPPRVYTGGQALFDRGNPLKLVARSDVPFIKPTEDYERTGQYPQGTTFVEGVVPLRGRWYLYDGTADSQGRRLERRPGERPRALAQRYQRDPGPRRELPADRRRRSDRREAVRHDPPECDRRQAHGGGERNGPFRVCDRPGQEGQSHDRLSHEHGPQLRRSAAAARFGAAHGEAHGGDAGQLEAWPGRDHPDVRLGRRRA